MQSLKKTVFSRIQEITITHLNKTFDSNEEFLKGFSGYIFRIHFQEVFRHIADFILYEIADSNTDIVNFFKILFFKYSCYKWYKV